MNHNVPTLYLQRPGISMLTSQLKILNHLRFQAMVIHYKHSLGGKSPLNALWTPSLLNRSQEYVERAGHQI